MNSMHCTVTRSILCIYRHAYQTCSPSFIIRYYHLPGQPVQSYCKYPGLVSRWTVFSFHARCRRLFHSPTCIRSQTLNFRFIGNNSTSQPVADESEDVVDEVVTPLTLNGSFTLYKLSCDIQEQIGDVPLSGQAWKTLIGEILDENASLSVSLHGVIMKMIANAGKFHLAESLLNYLRSSGQRVNIVTLATYIALCGEVYHKEKQDELFAVYEEVKAMSNLFDATLCRYLIDGLSMTDRWVETLALLEMVRISSVPNSVHYSPIASAAFREGDYETGMELLKRMGQGRIVPYQDVFSEYVNNVPDRRHKSQFTVELLLQTMRTFDWIPSQIVAEQIAAHFTSSRENWRQSWTSVSERGVCCSCGQTHPVLELTAGEFSQLQHAFLQKALISDNVYLKSQPEELNRYLKFIHSCPRFDVIVDGLNMAKAHRAGGSHTTYQIKQLKQIVQHLQRVERMTVLVLGRKHMQRWNINRLTACFLLDNISADDPFLLHATLYSGRRTQFLSNDKMNDHHHLLGTDLGNLFRKWQRSRQIKLPYITPARLEFKKPKCYDTLISEDSNGWHIPYLDAATVTDDNREEVTHDEVDKWLCLRKKSGHTFKS